jgi:putative transposase
MRYRASEKREIIDLVERSSLPVRRTLDRLGIPRSTFYGWYERYREGGDAALEDTRPGGGKVWNRLPDKVRQSVRRQSKWHRLSYFLRDTFLPVLSPV